MRSLWITLAAGDGSGSEHLQCSCRADLAVLTLMCVVASAIFSRDLKKILRRTNLACHMNCCLLLLRLLLHRQRVITQDYSLPAGDGSGGAASAAPT